MIEGINNNFQIQNIQDKKLTAPLERRQNTTTNPIDNYTMAGLESLGVYNMSLVKNKNQFDHKPAELIIPADTKMSQINGNEVCDPYGKLEYIVQNNGNYETRYYPQYENGQMIDHIEIRDTFNGKLLKEQDCSNGTDWVNITEYPQEEPNVSYCTTYSNGKVEYLSKEEKMPNGSVKCYTKDFCTATPELSRSLSDKKRKNAIDVAFDSQNVVKNINVRKTVGNTVYNKSLDLNKGAVIGMSENKNTVVPNFMEREVLNDNDVTPTEKFDREKLEAMAKNSPNDIYSFYENGHLKEINDKNIKIEFNENGSQYIKEYLGDDITKITSYEEDGSISVDYKNGNTTKTLEISSDNKPTLYNISQDGQTVRSASFTDEGFLRWSIT